MVYLAGDIGGTKTNLAYFTHSSSGYTMLHCEKYPSADYSSLEDIIEKFSKDHPEEIEKACFGVAGPVQNGVCKTTNLPWVIDSKSIGSKFSIKHVFLINDLEANAYGIEVLEPRNFEVLQEGKARKGNRALVSAGTGLGEAGLYFDGEKHRPFPTEGGHCDFAPVNDDQKLLLNYLQKKYGGHVSYERVLSGQGFCDIYDFLVDELHFNEDQEVSEHEKAAIITQRALKKASEVSSKTLEMFVQVYASECANVALKFLSYGGLYIGGGIAPKILPALKGDLFLDAFLAKGRFQDLLKEIPISVILEENTALFGAARFCDS